MNPAAPAPELRALAPALAVVVAQILAGLRTLVAARFRVPAMAPHANALGGYLTRTWRRFERLMARLAAGTPPRPRAPFHPDTTRTPQARDRTPNPIPRFPPLRPRGELWLIRALPNEAAAIACQLQLQFDLPHHAELLAASPQAARLLRRVCRMLGVIFPTQPGAQPEPPPPPKPAPPDSTPPALAPNPARKSSSAFARRKSGPQNSGPQKSSRQKIKPDPAAPNQAQFVTISYQASITANPGNAPPPHDTPACDAPAG